MFDDCRVLVVGGAGFVGSNLVRLLLRSSESVKVDIIDNLLSAERCNIPDSDRVNFIEGSIADDQVLAQVSDQYDTVFHLACFHGNQSSIHDPLADHQNNTLTTLKLFEHLKNFTQLRRVVYSGAGCAVAEKTFDSCEASVEVDTVSLHMDSPYSISKILGEFYACYYHKQHGLPVVRARFQNVYGPGEILGAGQWRGTPATVWRNVVPTFIYKALHQEALPLQNGGDASRDFIFVEDIVRGLCACALKGESGDVYNLASGRETTIKELAEAINRLAMNPTLPSIEPRRSWDTSGKRYGSTDKAAEMLGFEAKVSIEEGLKKAVAWNQSNMELIKETISKHSVQLAACEG